MVEFGSILRQSLRLLMWVTLWIAAVGIVLRRQVVLLLFGWASIPLRAPKRRTR